MCACPACEPPESVKRPAGGLRRMAFFAVVVALLAVVLVLARQPGNESGIAQSTMGGTSSPEATVAALVAAEQSADVRAYATCFAGERRAQIDARLKESSEAELVDELKSRATNLTGHVTTDIQCPDPDCATLVLERVFKNHNSRSRVRLNRFGGEWKITELTPLDNFAPEIPYGTPVFELQPGKKSQISNSKSQTNSKSETGK